MPERRSASLRRCLGALTAAGLLLLLDAAAARAGFAAWLAFACGLGVAAWGGVRLARALRRRDIVVALLASGAGVTLALRALPGSIAALGSPEAWSAGAMAGVLGLGFLFGLRHATDADHIAAVGAIVSERRGWRAALGTGTLWGAGHTLSIVVAGLFVLALHVTIPERLARLLEFAVALMIIGLGGTALARALRARSDVHSHEHEHDGVVHRHLHFHEEAERHAPAPAAGASHRLHGLGRPGVKPFLVGVVHGLAGSAALTLLVLAQIASIPLGLAYLALFGFGSIGGMAIMSVAISLPFAAAASRPSLHRGLRVATGILSLAFGLLYAWSQVAPAFGG